ncbi:MAG: MoxR family ATPase [Proteobacteria bacterium]|nr:MoxR family ATPase [Pseudomonadota bacterium]
MNSSITALRDNIHKVLHGQDEAVEMAIICFLASGHLLIEDVPGVGKTTLAAAFAQSLGLSYCRLQFTSDILPSDILGVNIYDPKESEFVFHEGPIFTNILLADEINRAEPRAQSALLEAMFEHQVSLDGKTRPLPEPFMVIATQNPVDFSGTFPLPDSQLDRFLFRISMGYPDPESEKKILKSGVRRADVSPVLEQSDIANLFAAVDKIFTSDEIIELVMNIIHQTRVHALIAQGASTRAMLELMQAAKARAFVHNREFALPEDVILLAPAALAHRVRLVSASTANPLEIIESICNEYQK